MSMTTLEQNQSLRTEVRELTKLLSKSEQDVAESRSLLRWVTEDRDRLQKLVPTEEVWK